MPAPAVKVAPSKKIPLPVPAVSLPRALPLAVASPPPNKIAPPLLMMDEPVFITMAPPPPVPVSVLLSVFAASVTFNIWVPPDALIDVPALKKIEFSAAKINVTALVAVVDIISAATVISPACVPPPSTVVIVTFVPLLSDV